MKKVTLILFTLAVLAASSTVSRSQVNTADTRMMSQPAVSADKIAFIYANDLWTAGLDGSNPKRLTVDEGIESTPFFSPDGKWIAFSAQYDGNNDVFIIPSEGGVPKRLTWHPSPDLACGFTPDGKKVMYTSAGASPIGRLTYLYTVSINGGFPEQVKVQSADKAAFSPDGKRVAYTPLRKAFNQWKHYRGGTVSTIWICTLSDYSVEKIPQPEGFCNDVDMMWAGDYIYFTSDRNGEFNLFSYNTKTKEVKQLTNYTDFPIQAASCGNGKIIYEQAGYLFLYDIKLNTSQKLTVPIAADLLTLRPRFINGSRYITGGSISPTGTRAVFDVRGEIITLPADKGDPRNLTNTTGAHEKNPTWSPDGRYIAYFSDESGEYEIVLAPHDGKGEKKKFKPGGAGFYYNLDWSPDSKKLSFVDCSCTLYYLDIETGKVKKVAQEKTYNSGYSIAGSWSPDSRWMAYTLITENWLHRVWLYNLEEDKSYMLTDGMADVTEPVFDASGKYLYFLGSTDAGPVRQWFDQSNIDMDMTSGLYLAVLSKDSLSPLAKVNDEEKPKPEVKDESDASKKDKEATDKSKDKTKDKKDKEEKRTVIDIDGIERRIQSIPAVQGRIFNLQSGKEGEVYYQEYKDGDNPASNLHKYDLAKSKDEVILPGCYAYQISADRNKVLLRTSGWYITALAGKPDLSQGKLKTEALEVYIDPPTEWKQIYDEVWRINRDYFYDPNYHGADWKAMKARYDQFIPHLSCRADLNRVIQWLCSELVVGHSYSGGGDYFIDKPYIPVGLLGADYAIKNDRYQFSKIFGGLNWNPGMRSPLTEPGVNVKEGDYLISVNGADLKSDENIFKRFENTSGKIVEITVADNPEGKDAKTYKVVPIGNEYFLRMKDWVEGNMKYVEKATNGKVAYVWVPDTYAGGHEYFKRYFFPQADKQAIIVDERFNGGGLVADYVIDILKREYICSNATRYGDDQRVPGGSIQGPKVMLINENAGSGGDLLPWMFRKFKVGPIIGKRTWGGLVGISGYPGLMDGGFVTSPNLGLFAEEGWICENVGTPPDIEVEQMPGPVAEGKDPQLDKAIEVIMDMLKKAPPVKHTKPPYPVKVKK